MNNFLAFQVHGNADHDGISAFLESLLVFLAGLLDKSLVEIFSSIMPGIAIMQNIHPLLVHFPIAFLTGFVLIDFVACIAKKDHWRELASGLLYLGTIMAAFTVLAGFVAANSVPHGDNVHEIMERHGAFGVSILCLATVLSGWRLKAAGKISGELNIFYLILSALLGLCLALGADLGGLMVYQYGVAVKTMPGTATENYIHHHHQH